jgi:hypothetical protein
MKIRKNLFIIVLVLIMLEMILFANTNIDKNGKRWDNLKLGNHRAVVFVKEKCEAVITTLVWRRRDKNPSEKAIIIIDSKTEKRIKDFVRIYINNFKITLIFKPESAPSKYYIYYLPYRYKGSKNYPKTEYLKYKNNSSSDWMIKYSNLTKDEIEKVPQAEFIAFQSVDEFNEFTRMEKIATNSEVEELISKYKNKSYLLFPEHRGNIIRMFDRVPLTWVRKVKGELFLRGLKGEYLPFQIGVFPFKYDLKNISVKISDFIGKSGKLDSKEITCFNIEGVNIKGEKFIKSAHVEKGRVLPLWFGINIKDKIKQGDYSGIIKIKPINGEEQKIKINLKIEDKKIINHGDDEPNKLTRLRWLNSKIGSDNKPVKPYIPIKIFGNKIKILGREIFLGKNGLPLSIKSFFSDTLTKLNDNGVELLKSSVRFIIENKNGEKIKTDFSGIKFINKKEGIVEWKSIAKGKKIIIDLKGQLEYDGYIKYEIDVKCMKDILINDIYLKLPIKKRIVKYMMGMGYKGGTPPEKFKWKWDVKNNQDSIWLGNVNMGIQTELFGKNYVRPLNTNFYHLKPLNMPPAWYNSGRGGFKLEKGRDIIIAKFFSGKRILKKGETLGFHFSFLITPFKMIDIKQHWKNRYFHSFKPIEEIKKTGANIINVHHATDINPFINYPFLRPEKMKKYIEEAHKNRMKVKIYYTVRELSNHCPEIFALKSLGDEIFANGKGGGPSWLVEHFGEKYIAGWFVPKFEDAAIINNGSSRWHNYYVEGLNWLVKNVGIDGIYIDDIAFDRSIMKRIRRVFEMNGKEAIIDVHSANQYNPRDGFASSANLYLEHFPFIDRLWFGEYFDYDSKPDYWLIEISGIPFGLMGEMLQGGGNPYRGMIYGMTARLPWAGNPKPLWKLWDDFGIEKSEMIGYWSKDVPVKTDNKDILSTVYKRKGRVLVAIASWAKKTVNIKLNIQWKKLGIDKKKAIIIAPSIKSLQKYKEFSLDNKIPVDYKKGWFLIIKERGKIF